MQRNSPNPERRGVTVVLVVLILPVLLILVGFSVDVAYMQLARTQLRVATDLAAKAASVELADTGDVASAIAKGKQAASSNLVAGQGLTLEDSDFVFGNTTKSMTGKWLFTPSGTPTNAVQVNSRRTPSSPDGAVNLFFIDLVGGANFTPTSTATSAFFDVDICLVLDRSGSMKLAVSDTGTGLGSDNPRKCDPPWSDSRWVAVENAVGQFVSIMNGTLADEQVAVVTFASNNTTCGETSQAATLDQPLTTYLSYITGTLGALSSSVWSGSTEISVGMSLARSELTGSNSRETANKVMIVLTDGVYTNGVHPSTEAALAAAQGIQVHTITFGAVPTQAQTDMAATASAGGGNHYHAPSLEILNDAFAEIAASVSILTQ